MSVVRDTFTCLCVLTGAFFFMAGTLGLLRFPDIFTRLHALTKVDSLGLGFIAVGLSVQTSGILSASKLIAVWLLVQLSGAIVTQLIARAAQQDGTHG